MASLKLKYEALTPEVKTQTQVFTGNTLSDCWNQMYDFNNWLAKGKDIKKMYKIITIEKRL